MSVTGRRCDEHHRRRGLVPEGPAGRGAGVRLTSCVRPDSPASPARCHPLGAKASEPIREPGASRSGHHTDVLSEGLSETALCPPGAHQLPSHCAPRLEFPTYTNSPVLLRRAPNRHLCWLRQYFPFIAVMRVNIFPEITSEKCAWILNTCDPDIRGERLFQTHTHTRVRASRPAAPRRRVVNSALRAAPQSFPGVRACALRGRACRWGAGPRSWGRGGVGWRPGASRCLPRGPVDCDAAPQRECPSHEPGMGRPWFPLPHPWPSAHEGEWGRRGRRLRRNVTARRPRSAPGPTPPPGPAAAGLALAVTLSHPRSPESDGDRIGSSLQEPNLPETRVRNEPGRL